MKLNIVMAIGSFGDMVISNINPARVETADGKVWNVPLSYASFSREQAKEFMLKYVDFFFDSIEKEQNASL